MSEWKIRVKKINEEEIHNFLDFNPAKKRYYYYFDWDNNTQDKKEFYHISQYEKFIEEHIQQYPNVKLLQIWDASITERKVNEFELIDILRKDGQFPHDFEIRVNNNPFTKYERFKTKNDFYSFKAEMTAGDPNAEITEIYETRNTIY